MRKRVSQQPHQERKVGPIAARDASLAETSTGATLRWNILRTLDAFEKSLPPNYRPDEILSVALRYIVPLLPADRGDFIAVDRTSLRATYRAVYVLKSNGPSVKEGEPIGTIFQQMFQQRSRFHISNITLSHRQYHRADSPVQSSIALAVSDPSGEPLYLYLESNKCEFFDEEAVLALRTFLYCLEARLFQSAVTNLRTRIHLMTESLSLAALARGAMHDAMQATMAMGDTVPFLIKSIANTGKLNRQKRSQANQVILKDLRDLLEFNDKTQTRIDYLRTLARDPSHLSKETCDLAHALRWSIDQQKLLLYLKNRPDITLSLRLPQRLPKVRGHFNALSAAFSNILENAIKYGGSKGGARRISVQAFHKKATSEVMVRINDSGPGFPPEVITYVMDPYAVSIRTAGLGVGLLVSKTLLNLIDAELTLFPGPGAKCEISFRICQ